MLATYLKGEGIETVLAFGPILATVVEQGNQEGVIQIDDPLSTVRFILAGSRFLMGFNEQMSDTVKDSPMTDRDYSINAVAGVLYSF